MKQAQLSELVRWRPSLKSGTANTAGGAVLAVGIALQVVAEEPEILPLPAWSPQDLSLIQKEPDAMPLGGLLWPDGFRAEDIVPLDSGSALGVPEMANAGGRASGSSIQPDHFLLFIPKPPRLPGTKPSGPPARHALVEVDEALLHEYESPETDTWLIDPHELLPETQSEDLRRLLAYHAGEASTLAHFLLLNADEQLPAGADLSRLAGGQLVQQHSCVVAYPLGEPWRARLFMTGDIVSGVPPEYLRSLLAACVQDAMQASDPVEQLQRFAIQLSIRLIWLERAHPAIFAPAAGTSTGTAPALSAGTLTDVMHDAAVDAAQTAPPVQWRRPVVIGAWCLAALLAFLLAVTSVRRWLRRRHRNSVRILPEVSYRPRLGAPHCGQGGAWIRYG